MYLTVHKSMSQARVLAFARKLGRPFLSTRSAILTVAVLGILATSLGTAWAWNAERADLVGIFENHVQNVAADIQNDINADLQVLTDLAIADQSVGGLEPGQFQTYVEQIMQLQPEVLGLSWVPRVADSDRASFERRSASQSHGGVQITELDTSGQFVPAARRAEYFPVQYAFQADGSAQGPFLGFDLASDPVRQRALLEADLTDQPAATRPITLFQAGGATRGFVAMRVVRNLGAPASSTGRRPISGYVQAIFATNDLIESTLALDGTTSMHVSFTDVTAGDDTAMPFYSSAEIPAGPVLHVSHISVAGRTWELSGSPTLAADIVPSLGTWLPVPVAGLLLTLLAITLLTLGLTRRRLELASARAREEFVAMVSHDLRTPAMSLIGGAEVLLGQDLPESERHDVLATMVREGRRLNSLLNDFLEADDAGHGRLRVAPRPTDLRGVLEHAVTAAGIDRHCPVRLTLPPELPWVLADPDRTQQLVGNLISNARKYSPAGGAIDLTAALADGVVQVAVTDQGLGLPAEALKHLFDPYYRVDSVSRRDIRGTGLGLAIVKGIVEAHGGQVGAESAGPGRGSRFWFTLQTAEQPEVAHAAPVELSAAAEDQAAPRPALRILVVDDEPAVGSMVRRLVRVHGHQVTVTVSAEQALEKLEHETFDVVLSDLGLGTGLDGWQLAAAVRTRWPHTRFLLATGTSGIRQAEARARGVDGVLTKPYGPEELRRAVTESENTSLRAA